MSLRFLRDASGREIDFVVPGNTDRFLWQPEGCHPSRRLLRRIFGSEHSELSSRSALMTAIVSIRRSPVAIDPDTMASPCSTNIYKRRTQ